MTARLGHKSVNSEKLREYTKIALKLKRYLAAELWSWGKFQEQEQQFSNSKDRESLLAVKNYVKLAKRPLRNLLALRALISSWLGFWRETGGAIDLWNGALVNYIFTDKFIV